jgi:hypothetical protein
LDSYDVDSRPLHHFNIDGVNLSILVGPRPTSHHEFAPLIHSDLDDIRLRFTVPRLTVGSHKVAGHCRMVHCGSAGHLRVRHERIYSNKLVVFDTHWYTPVGSCRCRSEQLGILSVSHPYRVSLLIRPGTKTSTPCWLQ